MAGNTTVNGNKIRWMDMEFSLGLMVADMMETMLMTRRKAKEFSTGKPLSCYILGLMVESTRVPGKMVSNIK